LVYLVVTHGTSSIDLYSVRLANYLKVPLLHTDIYQRIRRLFNKPLLSPYLFEGFMLLKDFVKRLRETPGIPHLPNHHLGRFGYFLGKPFIITVHDLMRYLDLVGGGPCLIRKPNLQDALWLHLDYLGAVKAAKIVVPSNHTKNDLVRYLKVPEEKVVVIYHGIDEAFKPVEGPRPCEEPYVLYVGSEHPRKNLATLLKAFKLLKQDPKFRELKLVKAGPAGGEEKSFRSDTMSVVEALGLKGDVIFVDRWLSVEELAALYSQAELFAFPSIYEGFGWPPLEAMACGCPVIASNTTSLPEVLGDAAMYADPASPEAWAEAMERVLTDDRLRRKLASMGLERAKQFTWRRAAEQLLRVYEEVEELYGA